MVVHKVKLLEENAIAVLRIAQHLAVVDHLIIRIEAAVEAVVPLIIGRYERIAVFERAAERRCEIADAVDGGGYIFVRDRDRAAPDLKFAIADFLDELERLRERVVLELVVVVTTWPLKFDRGDAIDRMLCRVRVGEQYFLVKHDDVAALRRFRFQHFERGAVYPKR